jgi:hypothetical protein
MNIENWWTKFKETEVCPNCGHNRGIMYELLGRDPVFSMRCNNCKEGFAFDFSEEKVETHLLVGDDPYGIDWPTFNKSFSEVIESMNRLGMDTENRV